MDRNLYAPPAAPVADPVEPATHRPVVVTRAVQLVGASLIVGFGAEVWTNLVQLSVPAVLFTVAFGSFRYVLSVWILLKLATGRNWARIVFLVVLALGLAYTAYNWHYYSVIFNGEHRVAAFTSASKVILDGAAACLLLMPAANRWFRPAPINTTAAYESR